jgi:hypothetical protein
MSRVSAAAGTAGLGGGSRRTNIAEYQLADRLIWPEEKQKHKAGQT